MVDTRAGRWLLISIALLTALAMAILLIVADHPGRERQLLRLLRRVATVPMALLLPVLGILSVTSEWGQRTHMVTVHARATSGPGGRGQAGERRAGRAGCGGGVFALGAVCNLIYASLGATDMTWDVGVGEVVSYTLLHVLGLLTGFAFGMLIVNTAAAIVVFFAYSFVLPGITSRRGGDLRAGSRTSSRGSTSRYTQTPLTEGDLAGSQWPEFVVSGLLWFVLPLALGIWRLLRAEVK